MTKPIKNADIIMPVTESEKDSIPACMLSAVPSRPLPMSNMPIASNKENIECILDNIIRINPGQRTHTLTLEQ